MKNTTTKLAVLFIAALVLITPAAVAQLPSQGFRNAYTVYDSNGFHIYPSYANFAKYGPFAVTPSLSGIDVVSDGSYAIGVEVFDPDNLMFYTLNADGTTRSGPHGPVATAGTILTGIEGVAIVGIGGGSYYVLPVEYGNSGENYIHVCTYDDGTKATNCVSKIPINGIPTSGGNTVVGVNGYSTTTMYVTDTSGSPGAATIYQIDPQLGGGPAPNWGFADSGFGTPEDDVDTDSGSVDTVATNGKLAFGVDDPSDSVDGFKLHDGGPAGDGAVFGTNDNAVACTGGSFNDNGGEQNMVEIGDAPDSTNNWGLAMTAYAPGGGPPNIPAVFPTCINASLPGSPGPCHDLPFAWFGSNLSYEYEADLFPDQDGIVNINVSIDTPDQDFYDDGLVYLFTPHCPTAGPGLGFGTLAVNVTYGPSYTGYDLYLNAWIDFNMDGDWADNWSSPGGYCTGPPPGNVSEWIVQNMNVGNGSIINPPSPVTQLKVNNAWLSLNNTPNQWLRITLSEAQFTTWANHSRGAGSGTCFEDGETEDY